MFAKLRMIATNNLELIAADRLTDAEALLSAGRYDGASYLCGYALEVMLKHKICITLNWLGFPETNNEFEKYKSLKTHDLGVLLRFTGRESFIQVNYFADWSAVMAWNPEHRYRTAGFISEANANQMIESAKVIMAAL